ncbi:MAG: T9SS type A sorting domain-containing protein [Flavobacteriales bacterium]|nr:T9SS type A sorting domain-containing protein [Flavobacteriales bacterium]
MLLQKLFLVGALSVFLLSTAYSQQPYFCWVKDLGGDVHPYTKDQTIATDAAGNVYATGSFTGTVDFDPGLGTSTLTTPINGSRYAYVSKLDSDGNFLWVKQFGGLYSYDSGVSITIDVAGNICIVGTFNDVGDFDPSSGTATLTPVGETDVFMVKLDSSGNFLWAKSFGSTLIDDVSSITTDDVGNIYTVGNFRGTADFDPGVGVSNQVAPLGMSGFISKLDANGNFIWAQSFGGANGMWTGGSVTIDVAGDVYVTGRVSGTVDFDSGAGTSNTTCVGAKDMFILKLDASGNYIWAKNTGAPVGIHITEGISVAVDLFNNVLVTGKFKGTVDFDLGSGVENHTAPYSESTFVLKLDENGNYIWSKSVGSTSGAHRPSSILSDMWGNVYTVGYFYGLADFDPGVGVVNLQSSGCPNMYILKLDINGDYMWAEAFGETENTVGYSLAKDNIGGIFVSGEVGGNMVDLEPGLGVTSLSGYDNQFILKLSDCLPNSTVTACDSYTWADSTYTTTGIYTSTPDDNGCTVATLDLTIHQSTFSTTMQTACDSYSWNGTNYSNSGTYYWTGANQYGCDSTATLHLDITNSATSTTSATACESYTWNGNTYTTSGVYDWVGVSSMGCDSIASLDLTINTVSNLNMSFNGTTIYATNLSAAYQWLDCDNGFAPITGETNQSFTPSSPGHYAVQLIENGCVDTTACLEVLSAGIVENTFDTDFELYPNPTEGNFQIVFNQIIAYVKMKITDAAGRKVAEKTFTNTEQINYELNEPKGTYTIELSGNNHQRSIIRLIKK